MAAPTLFTELVQLRKLYDRDPRLSDLADKVAAKSFVAERLGAEWIVPTLWSGDRLPLAPPWPSPFVVKSRHGCNHTLLVRDDREPWAILRQRAHRWLARPYGGWLDEWLYREIPRGLVVEPFIGAGRDLPVDYKIYVFGGRAAFVQAHVDREHDHRWVVHDRGWRPLDADAGAIARPSRLDDMLGAAEALARGFDFVRVDFYQPGDQPLFGEMSFYPGSGLDPFDPPELDVIMGGLWLDTNPVWLWSVDPIMDRLEAAAV